MQVSTPASPHSSPLGQAVPAPPSAACATAVTATALQKATRASPQCPQKQRRIRPPAKGRLCKPSRPSASLEAAPRESTPIRHITIFLAFFLKRVWGSIVDGLDGLATAPASFLLGEAMDNRVQGQGSLIGSFACAVFALLVSGCPPASPGTGDRSSKEIDELKARVRALEAKLGNDGKPEQPP